MPIETLTSEQERMLEGWSAAWLQSARGTTPADRLRAEQVIAGLYHAAGRFAPLFVWVDSPLSALLARGVLTASGLEGPLPVPSTWGDSANAQQPMSHALTRPRGFVDVACPQLGPPARERISRSLVEPLRTQDASEQVWLTAYEWLYSRAWKDVWCKLREGWQGQCIDARVRDVVRDGGLAVKARATVLAAFHAIYEVLHTWDEPWSAELWLGRASLDQSQITEYAFSLRACGTAGNRKYRRQLALLEEVSRSGGWWWPGERVCIMCERPCSFHVDGRGRVHHPSRAAIEFRDGFQVYLWRGANVPKSWIVEPSSINPRWALNVSGRSSETRRVITEIVGWKRIVELMQPRVIDTDVDPAIGELLEVELPSDPTYGVAAFREPVIDLDFDNLRPPEPRFARFLKVRCGTGREFVLSVPRDLHTAREANAWTYGLSATEYNLEVRT